MRIAIFDDGAGNVHSLAKVLASHGEVAHERDAAALCEADLVVLPGVGAFDTAMEHLGDGAAVLSKALDDGLPCLAICLGAQLLFDRSDEGERDGLGVLPGTVRRLPSRRLPHIGWEVVSPAGTGEPTLEDPEAARDGDQVREISDQVSEDERRDGHRVPGGGERCA